MSAGGIRILLHLKQVIEGQGLHSLAFEANTEANIMYIRRVMMTFVSARVELSYLHSM